MKAPNPHNKNHSISSHKTQIKDIVQFTAYPIINIYIISFYFRRFCIICRLIKTVLAYSLFKKISLFWLNPSGSVVAIFSVISVLKSDEKCKKYFYVTWIKFILQTSFLTLSAYFCPNISWFRSKRDMAEGQQFTVNGSIVLTLW